MSFWILIIIVLAVVVFAYNSFDEAYQMVKKQPKLIFPILIGMLIGYLIFF